MTRIDTDRLTLGELTDTDEDAAFIRRLLNEPAYMRFIGDRGVRTAADARAYLRAGPLASYQQQGFGLYRVALKTAPAAALGVCGLIKRPALADVDLGYAFLPEYWSQGYAVEAAAAVLRHAQTVLGLKRIVAIVTPDNARSIGVLTKLGLRFERPFTWPDDGSELSLYGIEA